MNGTVNKVILIGHLGDDVKMHYFDGGNCIARFPLATNEVYINKQTNEKITSTEWHNLVVRNKAAEICEKYLSKGDKINGFAQRKAPFSAHPFPARNRISFSLLHAAQNTARSSSSHGIIAKKCGVLGALNLTNKSQNFSGMDNL